LLALTLLAMLALASSDLPLGAVGIASAAALLYGARLAHGEWRQERLQLHWSPPATELRVLFGGRSETWRVGCWHLRGPLAALLAFDERGRRRRLLWWPDTLPAPARRRLRLASVRRSRSPRATTLPRP
jgi:toxin CptA